MKKNPYLIFVILFCLFSCFGALPASAAIIQGEQTSPAGVDAVDPKDLSKMVQEISIGGPNTANGVNCFDYYKFGSIDIIMLPDKLAYKNGETAEIAVRLKNGNNYPIVQGDLFAQVFRAEDQGREVKYGNNLVDEFFVENGINLNALGEQETEFSWDIPENISSGSYFIATHFLVDKKLNLSGLTFLEGAYGGITRFEISNEDEIKEVSFDKTKVTVNGQPFFARSFIPQLDSGQNAVIDYTLNNITGQNLTVDITKKLYKWDNLLAEQLIVTQKETLILKPKENRQMKSTYPDLAPGVYIFETTADSSGTKSILKVRFAANGKTLARLNFSALEKFPAKKGEQNYIFSCFHNTSDSDNFEGRVKTELKDGKGNIIAQTSYEGMITPQMMAVKNEFTPDQDLGDLWLTSTLYDKNGAEIDKTNLKYSCGLFKEPASIDLAVENDTVEARLFNICGSPVAAGMAVEADDSKGNTFFFEPDYFGQEFKKTLAFKPGETYTVSIWAGALKKTVKYPESKTYLGGQSGKIMLILLLALAAVSIIVLAIYFSRRRSGESEKRE